MTFVKPQPSASERGAFPKEVFSALLVLLLERGPMSRSELAEVLGLSRPTLTEMSRQLLESGILREGETVPRRGKGRPSIGLELNPAFGFFVGVQVTGQELSLVLTDPLGQVVASSTAPSSPDVHQLSRALAQAIEELRQGYGVPKKQLRGLGVSLSGYVDQASGTCWQSANLGWFDVPVAQIVAEATGLPTAVENDAKAAALSEKLFGLARDTANFTLVTLGESVGAAHFMRGELYRGTTGAAGELAHCTVAYGPQARLCRCGKRGCLDTVASGMALVQRAQEAGLAVNTASELELLAVQGDETARRLLQEGAQALGIVLSFVAQSHDPELLIIADLNGFTQGYFLTLVRQTIENNILPRLLSTLRIELHPVTPDFWARGAASVATQQFFQTLNSKEMI